MKKQKKIAIDAVTFSTVFDYLVGDNQWVLNTVSKIRKPSMFERFKKLFGGRKCQSK